jgi:uncharacterized membrane protein YdfJ with MMPL/SSD domain
MVWTRVAGAVLRGTAARPRTLLAAWGVVVLVCAPFAPCLLKHTSVSAEPPDNSLSSSARHRINSRFHSNTGQSTSTTQEKDTSVIYVEAPEGTAVVGDTLKLVSDRAIARYANFTVPDDVNVTGHVESYWTLMEAGQRELAERLVSGDGRAAIISISFRVKRKHEGPKGVGKDVLAFISELTDDPAVPKGFYLGATGLAVISDESLSTILRDMGSSDVVVVPLALLCVGVMVKSWRLLGITLVNFLTSFALSFSATNVVAQFGFKISTMAPALMSSVLLALSIDYSLFLLTRYAEEISNGKPVREAVELAILFAGHTIVGSGSTLCLCFAALMFFPLQLISTMGLGVGVAIVCAMLTNILLTPVLIFSAPQFFSSLGWCSRPQGEQVDTQNPVSKSRCLYRFARGTTSRWTLVVVTVLLCCAGWFFAPICEAMITDGDLMKMVPRGSVSSVTGQRMSRFFPIGFSDPMTLLFEPEGEQVFDPTFFRNSFAALQNISALVPADEPTTIISPVFVRGTSLPFNVSAYQGKYPQYEAELFRQCHESFDQTVPSWWYYENPSPCKPGLACCTKVMRSTAIRTLIATTLKDPSVLYSNTKIDKIITGVREMLHDFVNLEGTAMLAKVVINEPMGSKSGLELVDKMRKVIGEGEQVYGFDFAAGDTAGRNIPGTTVSLAGSDAETADLVALIDSCTRPILAATFLLVLLVMGFMYRSIMIPVRGIVTIGLTCVTGFALTVAIYQFGVFGDSIPFLAPVGAINFLVPAMAFTMTLGLSLDYDVFLLGRIIELRDAGYGDQDAIVLGGVKTNKIITAAGTIMSIAFSGLLMSHVTLLNMCGVVLITSVVLDTFVMRTVVTPALMALLGKANWFPRKVPAPTRSLRRAESGALVSEELAPAVMTGTAPLLAETSAV